MKSGNAQLGARQLERPKRYGTHCLTRIKGGAISRPCIQRAWRLPGFPPFLTRPRLSYSRHMGLEAQVARRFNWGGGGPTVRFGSPGVPRGVPSRGSRHFENLMEPPTVTGQLINFGAKTLLFCATSARRRVARMTRLVCPDCERSFDPGSARGMGGPARSCPLYAAPMEAFEAHTAESLRARFVVEETMRKMRCNKCGIKRQQGSLVGSPGEAWIYLPKQRTAAELGFADACWVPLLSGGSFDVDRFSTLVMLNGLSGRLLLAPTQPEAEAPRAWGPAEYERRPQDSLDLISAVASEELASLHHTPPAYYGAPSAREASASPTRGAAPTRAQFVYSIPPRDSSLAVPGGDAPFDHLAVVRAAATPLEPGSHVAGWLAAPSPLARRHGDVPDGRAARAAGVAAALTAVEPAAANPFEPGSLVAGWPHVAGWLAAPPARRTAAPAVRAAPDLPAARAAGVVTAAVPAAAPPTGGVAAAMTGVDFATCPGGSRMADAMLSTLDTAFSLLASAQRSAAQAPHHLRVVVSCGDSVQEMVIPLRTGHTFKMEFTVEAEAAERI